MAEVVPNAVEEPPLATRGRSFYLATAPAPIFAVVHLPEVATRANTGVVLCPPFGWDELSAHRSVRCWAGALAQGGYAALRFDLPATGDSAGTLRDPRLLDSWTAAVDAAAASLRAVEGCERIVAIGIGLGGMLACRALMLGGPLDDLVLWGVHARGRTFIRELQAFSLILTAESVHTAAAKYTPPPPDEIDVIGAGAVNASGFVLSAETAAALESLDLSTLEVPDAGRRRVLLLRRDSGEIDRRLRELFERSGVELTVSNGPGYGAMMVDPQFAKPPWQVFERTNDWLAAGAHDAAPAAAAGAGGAGLARGRNPELELTVDDVALRETLFEVEFGTQLLSGVLTEPLAHPAGEPTLSALLLNPGAVRRIGHHRMWVDIARRWAARGVPTLRLDVIGVGDSDGAEGLYEVRTSFQRAEFAEQVIAAFDELERRGLPNQFIVGGLCSGAYWGLHAALADDRVRGLLLVNLLAFFWSDDHGAMRDARRTRTLLRERDLGTIARIVASDRWRIARMARVIARRARSGRTANSAESAPDGDIVDVLDRLRERDVETLLLLSLGEPLYDDLVAFGLLERLGEWPNLHLDRVPTAEHVFRSVWSQLLIHEALDDALARTLGDKNRRSVAG